jgi:hypothetical protein
VTGLASASCSCGSPAVNTESRHRPRLTGVLLRLHVVAFLTVDAQVEALDLVLL